MNLGLSSNCKHFSTTRDYGYPRSDRCVATPRSDHVKTIREAPMSRMTRRSVLGVSSLFAAALAGVPRKAGAQQTTSQRRRRALVIGRQPLAAAGVAITRHMMETR